MFERELAFRGKRNLLVYKIHPGTESMIHFLFQVFFAQELLVIFNPVLAVSILILILVIPILTTI